MPTPSTRTPRTRNTKRPVQDKPAPVSINLDTLEREGDQPGPYGFAAGGRHFEMIDATEIPWQDLLDASRNPLLFFGHAMQKADSDAFLKIKLPSWKLNALIKDYLEHWGIDAGELLASSTS